MLPKAHWHRTTHHDRSAFTLIELLVVLSIITLLAAMLLPSLGSAREQAKRSVCGYRMRQWAVAFDCYAAENNGFYPHCDGTDRGPRALDDPRISNADLADWHGWVDLLPPMIDLPAWRDYRRWDKPKEDTFFQCPSGIPFEISGLYSYRPEREGYFSYAMNSCLELDANAWPPADGRGYPMPSFLDTARIHTPSRVFILFDQLLDPRKGFDENKLYRGAGKHCGSYPKSFSARHRSGRQGLGGNIMCADGHVEWRRSVWEDAWDIELEVPPRDDRNWYPYPAPVAVARSRG